MNDIHCKTSLLPYQADAAAKLTGLKVGALYMEMGTGKTRTALELVSRRLAADKIDAALWLCPCSVKRSIRAEIDKHLDAPNGLIEIHGIESLSSSLTLYSRLYDFVRGHRVMLVVDESNLVKNHAIIRSQRIQMLARQCPYRLILNGTPISRNEGDLYGQWLTLDWRILGYRSFWSFAANHLQYDERIPGRVVRTLNVDYLVRKIAPYTVQVKKKDVLTLPEKTYRQHGYYMTNDQSEHYNYVADRTLLGLDELRPETIYRMFAALQAVISGLYVDVEAKHMKTSPMFAKPMDNPRIQKLLDVLSHMETAAKVVVFAKYTHEIQSIMAVLTETYGEGSAVPFYGGLSQGKRQENLASFAGSTRYLVANKACAGYGLNLQFCHNVVFYSNDWDYATRAQAEDRVHRIGQTQDVTLHDIFALQTLDERILSCLNRKENILQRIKTELAAVQDQKALLAAWIRGDHVE